MVMWNNQMSVIIVVEIKFDIIFKLGNLLLLESSYGRGNKKDHDILTPASLESLAIRDQRTKVLLRDRSGARKILEVKI